MTWEILYTQQALKDSRKIAASGLKRKVQNILRILQHNPYLKCPHFEKLVGDLSGAYSRRINSQHRVVYQIYEKEKIVKIIRMWTHYE